MLTYWFSRGIYLSRSFVRSHKRFEMAADNSEGGVEARLARIEQRLRALEDDKERRIRELEAKLAEAEAICALYQERWYNHSCGYEVVFS